MEVKTIKITDFSGTTKDLTREQFIKQWSSCSSELWKLTNTVKDIEIVKEIKFQVAELASRQFDNIYNGDK